jgi:hypothetical protein
MLNKIIITGVATAGKSTTINALMSKGVKAIDPEVKWRNTTLRTKKPWRNPSWESAAWVSWRFLETIHLIGSFLSNEVVAAHPDTLLFPHDRSVWPGLDAYPRIIFNAKAIFFLDVIPDKASERDEALSEYTKSGPEKLKRLQAVFNNVKVLPVMAVDARVEAIMQELRRPL